MDINTVTGVRSFLQHRRLLGAAPIASARELWRRMPLRIYTLEEQPEPWCVYLLRSLRRHAIWSSAAPLRRSFLDYTRKLHDAEREVTDY